MKVETQESIDNYVNKRWEPGGFLTAVLANDLMQAFGKADIENREDMFEIVSYIYNRTPIVCHGSYEKVEEWLKPDCE